MLDDILGRYRSFLRLPDVARLLITALITRLPIASLTLAMLTHVRALTGSFGEAGLTVGVDLAASAIAAPVLGRIIDRRGPRSVMLATGIVCPLALLFILLADKLALSVAGLIAAAAIAGAFAPPITVLTRTVWRYRFDDPGERKTAFALDAVLIELAFTVGPMLVALLLAVASPRAAFAAAFILVALAVPIFAWSPALKYWRHQPGVERRLLGPLADPRLLAVYAVTFLLMFSLGLLEIGYAGFATAAAMPAFAGILIAVNSVGSGAGGLLYGGTQLAMPVERQLPRLTPGGGYAEYCATPAAWCLPYPEGMSALEAASLPENYFTVWNNLFDRASSAGGRNGFDPRRLRRHRIGGDPARAPPSAPPPSRPWAATTRRHSARRWAPTMRSTTGSRTSPPKSPR